MSAGHTGAAVTASLITPNVEAIVGVQYPNDPDAGGGNTLGGPTTSGVVVFRASTLAGEQPAELGISTLTGGLVEPASMTFTVHYAFDSTTSTTSGAMVHLDFPTPGSPACIASGS